MENSNNHGQHQQSESQCPQCGNRYSESSSSGSKQSDSCSQQRIMIPLHKDLFQQNSLPHQNSVDEMLANLKKQIEQLKRMNYQKDKVIDDMKKDMEHKMTHYMLYGELNKQNDQINRLRNEILKSEVNISKKKKQNLYQPEQINRYGKIVNKFQQNLPQEYFANDSFGKDFNLKSTFNVPPKKMEGFKKTKKSVSHRKSAPQIQPKKNFNTQRTQIGTINEDYFNSKSIFKISEAKKRIFQLENLVRKYEEELMWLHNFSSVFVKTMENISQKKYSQKIIMQRWNQKKKVKVAWRYLKHLLAYLYEQPDN